jgi:hypothetical protein
MLEIFFLATTAGAGIAGYVASKDFTQRKLRFVDAVHRPGAALIAGGVAALVAAPIVAVLPIVTGVTAVALGVGVALGVKTAQKNRHLLP